MVVLAEEGNSDGKFETLADWNPLEHSSRFMALMLALVLARFDP